MASGWRRACPVLRGSLLSSPALVLPSFADLGLSEQGHHALRSLEITTPTPGPGRRHPRRHERRATCSAAPRPAPARRSPSACRSWPAWPASSSRPKHPRALIIVPTRELATQVRRAIEPAGVRRAAQARHRVRRHAVRPPDQAAARRRRHRRRHPGPAAGPDGPGPLPHRRRRRSPSSTRPTTCATSASTRRSTSCSRPPRPPASGCCSRPPSTVTSTGWSARTCARPCCTSSTPTRARSPRWRTTCWSSAGSATRSRPPSRSSRPTRARSCSPAPARAPPSSPRRSAHAGIEAVDLHGNLSQRVRERNLHKFSSGKAQVVVATDVAARGIHVDNVGLVVHFDAAGGRQGLPAPLRSYGAGGRGRRRRLDHHTAPGRRVVRHAVRAGVTARTTTRAPPRGR